MRWVWGGVIERQLRVDQPRLRLLAVVVRPLAGTMDWHLPRLDEGRLRHVAWLLRPVDVDVEAHCQREISPVES